MVTVRLATVADIDVLVDLMRDFYAESNFPLDAAWAAQSFADLLANPAAGAIWVIDVDGRRIDTHRRNPSEQVGKHEAP